MFQSAIQNVLGFTRPMHTITRSFSGLISPGSSTLFFVNDHGVAVTCKHVMNLITAADKINQNFQHYKVERDRMASDPKTRKNLHGLEVKYHYSKETTVQMKNNFLNCFDKFEQITCHAHPTLDLAILVFHGFNKILYSNHATFVPDNHPIGQGKYLCRIGFPFPEYNNFKHNPVTDDIEWTREGIQNSPSFPIDGIITRFVGDPNGGGISGIEMSTPGLRGQSGGPLFDTEGRIYGMQYATNHLHLGFDLKDKEIIQDGRKNRVSNFPFLHVGHCVHVLKIKEFLRQHNVAFTES